MVILTSYSSYLFFDPTVSDIFVKRTQIDNITVGLEIIDTACEPGIYSFCYAQLLVDYSFIRSQYMRSSEGFVIMYSITDRDSFDQVEALIQIALQEKESTIFPCVIVG